MSDRSSARTALVFAGVASLFVMLFVVVHVAALALLLAFAGVLFGVTLRGAAEWIAAKLRWRVRWALLVCVLAWLLLSVAVIVWIVPRVDAHVASLAEQLGQAYDQVRSRLASTSIGAKLGGFDEPLQYVSHAIGILASAVGALSAALVVAFVALHVAFDPDVYRRGILSLVPRAGRGRASEVMSALARTLRRWLLGRFISMAAVGIATTIGLILLGIPLPVTLGILAGLLGFIPNLGPIAAAIPALLLAATIDLAHVGYVAALYTGINVADGYGLTPVIERRAVATPAALVIIGQLVFAALWGIVGLMLATPLIACVLVLVRMLVVDAKERDEADHAHGERAKINGASASAEPRR